MKYCHDEICEVMTLTAAAVAIKSFIQFQGCLSYALAQPMSGFVKEQQIQIIGDLM